MFDELMKRIDRLRLNIAGKPELRWGVVSSASPLAVQLDGDVDPLAGSPSTLVGARRVGDRVQIAIQNRRATIIGVAGGIGSTFALKSQLNAWAAIDGTRAWVQSESREYLRRNGKWRCPEPLSGMETLTAAAAGGEVTTVVTFPSGYFTTPPRVFVSSGDGAGHTVTLNLSATGVTANSATIRMSRSNGTVTRVNWIAHHAD